MNQNSGEYVPYNINARIGCGQGKTTIAIGWAKSKNSIGNKAVITTANEKLAGQSFSEMTEQGRANECYVCLKYRNKS